jgi:hypothetical protein
MPSVKHGPKDLSHPLCLGKNCGFGFRNETHLQHFRLIHARTATTVLGFKDHHHVRGTVPIAVLDDELGATEDADETSEPNEQAGFLEHLTNRSIRRGFGRLDGSAGEEPNPSLRVTCQQDTSISIAKGNRDRRNLEQLLTANHAAKPSDVLSHAVKLSRGKTSADCKQGFAAASRIAFALDQSRVVVSVHRKCLGARGGHSARCGCRGTFDNET